MVRPEWDAACVIMLRGRVISNLFAVKRKPEIVYPFVLYLGTVIFWSL